MFIEVKLSSGRIMMINKAHIICFNKDSEDAVGLLLAPGADYEDRIQVDMTYEALKQLVSGT